MFRGCHGDVKRNIFKLSITEGGNEAGAHYIPSDEGILSTVFSS